ncbi:MAG TPA: chemotaxis protein CheW [Opitutales bacterium]|jgi:chemotaxis-related protein WspB|nr:chemotaxis protein CheW [Opitutales bacterium]
MLAVLFNLGAQRRGLATAAVERIVPALPLTAAPGAPSFVAGTFVYRGQIVPVIDLQRISSGPPVPPLLSTRIILVRLPTISNAPRLLGLLAGGVNDVRDISSTDADGSAPQIITLEELLPGDLLQQLCDADLFPKQLTVAGVQT